MNGTVMEDKVELQKESDQVEQTSYENHRLSDGIDYSKLDPDEIKLKSPTDTNAENADGAISRPQETSYLETLTHLFKGNMGPGCFAMADAMKNGGIVLGPMLTLLLGVICVHAQHILLKCSATMMEKLDLPLRPDYAETVELCFLSSTNERYRKLAPTMKRICNIFICVTQLGLCCIYFLFIGSNLKQVLDFYGLQLNYQVLVGLILIPIWLSALITQLKILGESKPCFNRLVLILSVSQLPFLASLMLA